jgi:hypothetical protein
LIRSQVLVVAVYSGPLNAGLAANALKCQVKSEGVPRTEGADPLIVALPGESNLQAVVFILDAET